ncbi:MAG: ABC transporter permease [Clostridia bacterium]|nr:ABC transporter permease [Clostridia bacterium]
MAEVNLNQPKVFRKLRHRGRASQIPIYLGKQLRFFVNQSDWKVLPMAAIIAALVSMVIRKDFFLTMEGNLKGAFALTCVGIWNGCFNSIQAVCRERPIIKREHRSGMHISSYIIAHMIYQFALCAGQTGLSMYVMMLLGVQFPVPGFMTSWMILDVGITLLLITYASDMMSLFISSVSHTTTGAMTVMPFVLIFQLVFSGGLLPLPDWTKPLANFTISNYGIKAMAAQSGYNEAPMVTAWKTLDKMRDNEIGGTVTLGQVLDLLDSQAVEKRRDMEIMKSFTVGEVANILNKAESSLHLRDKIVSHSFTLRDLLTALQQDEGFQQVRDYVIPISTGAAEPAEPEAPAVEETTPAEPDAAAVEDAAPAESEAPAVKEAASAEPETTEVAAPMTVGDLLNLLAESEKTKVILDKEIGATLTLGQVLDALHAEDVVSAVQDKQLNPSITLGQAADFLRNNEALQAERDREFTFKTTIGDLFELFGEENVKTLIQKKTAQASHIADYDQTVDNVADNWFMLFVFVVAFAALATISLEFIDKDRR